MITIGSIAAAIVALLRRSVKSDGPGNVIPLAEGTSTDEIARGRASDPEIRALLDEYNEYLEDQGVNTDWFSAEELTRLRRYGTHAIPPKHLWDEMARTILAVAQPIREEIDEPLRIYNAYRPEWYNKEVGGARSSLHIRNAALDLIPVEFSDRKRLAEIAARYAKKHGEEYRIGMGIYNYPKMTGVHVDALVRDRFTPYAATRRWMKSV